MQTEMEAIIKKFVDGSHERYGTYAFAAGYFSSWVRQFGEADPKVQADIIRQLTYSMENWENV